MENLLTRFTDSQAFFQSFPIVLHNCSGSWGIFLSLFHSFTVLPYPPLIVAIQNPPSRRFVLLTFLGFISLAPPPPGRSCVAIYIAHSLNLHLSCTTVFHDTLEIIYEDIFSPEGLFRSPTAPLGLSRYTSSQPTAPPTVQYLPKMFSPSCTLTLSQVILTFTT